MREGSQQPVNHYLSDDRQIIDLFAWASVCLAPRRHVGGAPGCICGVDPVKVPLPIAIMQLDNGLRNNNC